MLNDPATVRRRCHAIAAAVESGHSAHFRLDRGALPAIAQRIAALTRRRFPDLQIPYHSRWRHFEAGGVDRKDEIDALPGDVQVFHVEQLTVPGLQAERCIVWLRPVA